MKLRWRILALAWALLTCGPNNPQQSAMKESIFSYYDFGNVSKIQVQEYDSLYSSHFYVRRTIVDPDTIAALLDLLRILPGEGDIMVKFGGGVSFQKAIFMESDTKYGIVEIVGKRVKTPATSFYGSVSDAEKKFIRLLLGE
jgi:hypothetical protein